MAITGAVLFSALAFSYGSTWSTQHDLTSDSLEMSLVEMPFVDQKAEPFGPFGGAEGADRPRELNGQLVLVIESDSAGNILWTNDAPLSIDEDVLAQVVSTALASADNAGELTDLGLAWMRSSYEGELVRIAVADVSARNSVLRTQLIHNLAIFAGTMLVLLVIVRRLATWALKPVEEAWDRQRTFISDASHELKTPLAVIIANMQILQSDSDIPRESARWVDSTADEAAHMKELVNELLELARTDESAVAGSGSALVREDCNLSELVEGAALEFDAVAFERGCEIVTNVEDGIHASCDRSLVERAVKILLDNATKYAEQGSVVTVSLGRDKGRARLSVTNRGNVIDAEDLGHIFDRFYRTDKARQRESSGGFGLGLAIAKGIVEAHGGTICASSNEVEGTTFSVVI